MRDRGLIQLGEIDHKNRLMTNESIEKFHVKRLLLAQQVFAQTPKVHFKIKTDSGWKWTVCFNSVHYTYCCANWT